jgi:hypothetical protein
LDVKTPAYPSLKLDAATLGYMPFLRINRNALNIVYIDAMHTCGSEEKMPNTD